MRKCGCAFVTYLQTGYATATQRLILKISAQRILTHVHSPPMQMHNKVSGITGPKITKFVAV